MPTSSSESSEGTTARPTRRRTSTRTSSSTSKSRIGARTKKSAKEETEDVETVVESRLNESDDFGDGLDGEEKAAAKPARRKPAARRSAASRATSPRTATGRSRSAETGEGPTEPVSAEVRIEAEPSEPRTDSPPRQLAFFSSDEIDFGDGEGGGRPSVGGSDSSSGEFGEDGDRRPRRRRRRRRRGSGEGRVGAPDSLAPPGEGRSSGPGGRGDASRNSDPRGREPRGGDQRGADSRGGDSRGSQGGRSDGQRGRGGRRRGGRPASDDRSRRGRDVAPRGGDRGMSGPRRARQVQPSLEVIEGTFEGVLELHPKGYGFLRDPRKNYAAEDSNPFVSSSVVEKYQLREGVLVRGDVGQGTRNQGPRLRDVELIDGYTPEEYANVKHFDELTPINPFEQIRLETGPRPITMRVMDLLCPIGKGQRALLVAPPRTGKTMLLQDIANSVSENHPEIHLMVLLIDERPEEVTEMRRLVNGEIISSSLDNDVESHIRISQLIIERGKRLAEEGKDVFILLDSITRMARAFNKWSNSGRTASGGLDIRALDIPKKLFGTARRFDEGGSLTVCGTALIDTGSRMDEAIFQEFKGTGNMEMVLSRDLADRRIWPAIDVSKSGTRREEKILSPEVLEGTTLLRRSLISLSPVEAMEQLIKTMEKFPTNKEFLLRIRAVL